jgi:kinesin family protein 18/19
MLQVAVRCRPLTAKEKLKSRDILRVVDDKVSTTFPWRLVYL